MTLSAHQNFLEPSDLVGKVEGMVPYVGMVTIVRGYDKVLCLGELRLL